MNVKDQTAIENPDFRDLTVGHENKWVAISSDYKRLLAVGDTLLDALKQSSNEKMKVIVKVLPAVGYAPIVVGVK